MSLLRLANVTFAYPQQVSLIDSCDLELRPGWTGVVGRNGAGKSTLLNLIDGTLRPQSGRADHGSLSVARCRQQTTEREAVMEFATAWSAPSMKWMSLLRLEPEDFWRWDELSPGLQRRWQVAAALAEDPGILLLDEPTNHLDAEGREILSDALRRYDGIGVVVSHDRSFLDGLCAQTILVKDGSVCLYRGAYSVARQQWVAEADAALAELEAAQDRERALRSQLSECSNRHASAVHSLQTRSRMKSTADTDARSMAAKSRAQRAEGGLARRKGVVRAELRRAREALTELPRPESSGTIRVEGDRCPREVVLRYEGPLRAGERLLASSVDLVVRRDDRIRLSGSNGCGKTTLLTAALRTWDLPPERLLWVPQELREHAVRMMFQSVELEGRTRVLQVGAALGLDVERVLDGTSLSPGEIRKLAVALGLVKNPWLIVLDEPTNDLDIESIERLERALGESTSAIVVVTHDDVFAARLGTRELKMDCTKEGRFDDLQSPTDEE